MASGAGPAPTTFNINVVDLTNNSPLKFLTDNKNAIFAMGSELAAYIAQPIEAVVGKPAAKFSVQAPWKWTTSTGISFSLQPEASCSISVDKRSTQFSIANAIDSTETQAIAAGPADGVVYINIDMDFSISGNVSGSGTLSGIGISGKASGSAATTLSYCHPVHVGTNTAAAVKDAFEHLVFPFEPNCATIMPAGSIGKVNFDGSLSCELDVTYGFGSYKFSAPGVDTAKQSIQIGFDKITPPSVEIDSGLKASFGYSHTDHFGAIVSKVDASTAFLYLVRSAANEFDASAGLSVGIKCSPLSMSLDTTALAQAVNHITGAGGDLVAAKASQIQSSLVSKATQWLSNQKTDAGLMLQLSRQSNRALLYCFKADLTQADLVTQSWTAFSHGDIVRATQLRGLSLQPGSGVTQLMKQSVSIGFHFFNLFAATDVTTFFRSSTVEIGPDGSIRFHYDIGKEKDLQTKSALQKSRIHFVADASQVIGHNLQNVQVDLWIELSETGNAGAANRIAAVIGVLPNSAQIQSAQSAMRHFATSSSKGTLNVMSILRPSAYQRLGCSEYVGNNPPPLPQDQDKKNWNAFQEGCDTVLHTSLYSNLTYWDWEKFNVMSTNQLGDGSATGVPDRRNPGNPNNGAVVLKGDQQLVTFCLASAEFMNLCDDLHALAGVVAKIDTNERWEELLKELTYLVKHDVDVDWSKPTTRALLSLCSNAGSTVDVNIQREDKTLTCTVSLG